MGLQARGVQRLTMLLGTLLCNKLLVPARFGTHSTSSFKVRSIKVCHILLEHAGSGPPEYYQMTMCQQVRQNRSTMLRIKAQCVPRKQQMRRASADGAPHDKWLALLADHPAGTMKGVRRTHDLLAMLATILIVP